MLQINEKQAAEIRRQLSTVTSHKQARKIVFESLGLKQHLKGRRVLEISNLPIHCEVYETRGPERASTSPVVIFVPGFGTYAEMYCELLDGLAGAGFNAVGVDIRGHGWSGGQRGLYQVNQVVKDLSQVITRLKDDYNGPVVLFGSSIGSVLALACAERDRRVQALICHTLFLTEIPPDFLHLIGWFWTSLWALFMPHAIVDFRFFTNVNTMLKGTVLGEFAAHDDLLVWRYPLATLGSVYSRPSRVYREQVGFPAAIVIGDRDELIDLEYERTIIRGMRHPFDLIVIPGARHMLPFENIEDTIEQVSSWLSRSLVAFA